jgi:hypothetical protein
LLANGVALGCSSVMRRVALSIPVVAVVLGIGISTLQADAPKKPRSLSVPYSGVLNAKGGMTFSGVISLPPPVTMRVPPGSTMQLGPGTSIAINGPVTLGGNFVLNGNITIPKGAVITEATTPALAPVSPSSNSNEHSVTRDF